MQDFPLQVVDAGDEPNSLVELLIARPRSEDGGDIDFLTMQTDRATGGDEDVAVVEGIIEVRQALIGAP